MSGNGGPCFSRFGLPMQFVQMVVSVSVVLLKDLWWVGWVAGFGCVGIILGVRSLASARNDGGAWSYLSTE